MVRGLLIGLAALVLAAPAHAGGPTLLIGAAEDVVKQSDPVKAKAELDLAKLGGLDAIRITQVWTPGDTEPSAGSLKVDRTVVGAAQLTGIRIFVSLMNFGSRTTPLSSDDQDDFAAYAAALTPDLPAVPAFFAATDPTLTANCLRQSGPAARASPAPPHDHPP